MSRGIRSWVGRVALGVLLFFVAVLFVSVPIGVLGSSNLVWGEDNQYGRVDIPGTATLHLPAGSVLVSVAVDLVGRGNGTPDLPLPSDLALTLTPVGGAGQPVVTRVHGSSSNADDNKVNTQIEVWRVNVPHAGSYQVATKGDFDGIGIDPELWFGHGPPIPGTLVPVLAAGVVVVAGLVWFLIVPAVRRRRRPAAVAASPVAASPFDAPPFVAPPFVAASSVTARARSDDHLDRLTRLADLHDRGVLTDAEFASEKAKILGER